MELKKLREKIDAIDMELTSLLNSRFAIMEEIGGYKKANGLPILDKGRESEVLNRVCKASEPEFEAGIAKIFKEIMAYSKSIQEKNN